MICDQCGVGLTRWIKVVMQGGREYLFCGVGHLVEFFGAMERSKCKSKDVPKIANLIGRDFTAI